MKDSHLTIEHWRPLFFDDINPQHDGMIHSMNTFCLQSRNPQIRKSDICVRAWGTSGEINHMGFAFSLGFLALEEAAIRFDSTCLTVPIMVKVNHAILVLLGARVRWVRAVCLGALLENAIELTLHLRIHWHISKPSWQSQLRCCLGFLLFGLPLCLLGFC